MSPLRRLIGLFALASLASAANAQWWPGRAPGIRTGFQFLSVPSVAPTAPGYLATVSSAPYAAYGAQRVVSGYSGPLFQLRRSSDGATMDVSPQTGGDYPDYAAIATWAGASVLTVPAIYDQSGNARHMLQATVGNQPFFDPSFATSIKAAPFIFDGRNTVALGTSNGGQFVSIGGLTALNLNANARFAVMSAPTSIILQGLLDGSDDPATTYLMDWFYANTAYKANERNSGGAFVGGTIAAPEVGIDPSVIGLSHQTSTTFTEWGAGTKASGTASFASLNIPRLAIGKTSINTSPMSGKMWALAIFGQGLSTADGDAVTSSLYTAIGVSAANPQYNLVVSGDSIVEGRGSTLARTALYQLQTQLTKPHSLYGAAISGQTLQTIYGQRSTQLPSLAFKAGMPNVAIVQGGTNDLAAASATGSNVYSSYTAPLIAYLKGLGFKVIVCTLLPRNAGISNTNFATEWANYNALVLANSAGADYVLDFDANPVMGGPTPGVTSNTSLYADMTHPTNLGYSYLVGAPSGTFASPYTYYYALQQVLGVTP